MRPSIILQWVAGSIAAIAVAMVPPCVLALRAGAAAEAQVFALSALVCLTLAGGMLVGFAQKPKIAERASSLREVIAVMMAWWLVVPCFAALPLVFNGLGLVDGWYETVAAITTTGAWLSHEGARASAAGMLWRAELQSLGGLASLAFAAAVFIRPDFIGIETIIPPFSRGDRDSYLRATGGALRVFAPVYAGLTAIIILLFVLLGVPGLDATVLGLSLLASGGFLPSPMSTYPIAAMGPMLAAMVLGAINFVVLVRLVYRRHGRLRTKEDAETPVFFLVALLAAILFWGTVEGFSGTQFIVQMFNAVSVLSTNGMTIGAVPALVPVLVTAVIGGAAVSTAGGIKILRWIVTFRQAGTEIWKLGHPNGVVKGQRAANVLAIWMHFIAFTFLLGLLLVLVTFSGHSFDIGVTTAVAVVTNAGPLLSVASENVRDYNIFAPFLRAGLAFGMILGRLELVILLALINRSFWRI